MLPFLQSLAALLDDKPAAALLREPLTHVLAGHQEGRQEFHQSRFTNDPTESQALDIRQHLVDGQQSSDEDASPC